MSTSSSGSTYAFPTRRSDYTTTRWVPNIGWCGVHRLLYHWTVHCGITPIGYEDRYCFATEAQATSSMNEWDGEGDMPGEWHKHPKSGRCRDPKTGDIWHESEPRV